VGEAEFWPAPQFGKGAHQVYEGWGRAASGPGSWVGLLESNLGLALVTSPHSALGSEVRASKVKF
jgi:hypothetical protein